MRKPLEQLVQHLRSQRVEESLAYLDGLAARMAELPFYYPAHLLTDETDKTPFDEICQRMQVVEDRTTFEGTLGEEHLPAIPWDEYVSGRVRRAVIFGEAGMGKTWLLRAEARRLASEGAQRLRKQSIGLDDLVVPIFARLLDITRSDGPIDEALVRLAGAERSEAFCRLLREKLETERCVILLDGWDDVPMEPTRDDDPATFSPHHRQRLRERLQSFAHRFPKPVLLLTSRIVCGEALSIPGMHDLQLLPFDTPQVEAFVRTWFGRARATSDQFLAMLRQHRQAQELARIPLILVQMCRAHWERRLTIPPHGSDLYDLCLRSLLRDWKGEKEQREVSDAYVDAIIEMLQAVVCPLFAGQSRAVCESDMFAKLLQWLAGLTPEHELYGRSATSLIAEMQRDGLLTCIADRRSVPFLRPHAALRVLW